MNSPNDKGTLINIWLDIACLALVLLVLWFAFTLGIERGRYAILFLGISFAISVLNILSEEDFLGIKGKWLNISGGFLIVIFLAATGYLYFQYIEMLMYRAGAYTCLDVMVGAIIILSLFLLIWKGGGAALFILILLFLLYFYFGNYFPGIFGHAGYSVKRIIEETVLGFDGVYGIVMLTVSTWVAIFLIYAGIIQGFGTLSVIVKGCTIIFSRKRKLIPQVPVLASLIFGSFSGAATANVAGTGSFTISIMKRFGLPSTMAGAIESVASSGGQIMPPLMGATAFLMASFLGVSYLHIVAIGFLPALLFYLTLAFSVHFQTREYLDEKTGIFLEKEIWSKWDWLKLFPLVLSVVVLFTRLILMTPMMRACIEGIAVFIIAQLIHDLSVNPEKKQIGGLLRDFVLCLLNGIRKCAPGAAEIGLVGASMGLIVRVLTSTGLGPKLSAEMVEISHGSLPLLLLLTMILCIIFGMAVSTIAVYVLTVFIAAPALHEMGIPAMATHFMIFYLGNMSFITPPVAPAALVAAGISHSPFMPTAWLATKLGLPLFLLGVTFIYHPELVIWSWQTPISMIIVFIGLCGFASVFHLRYPSGWRPAMERVLLVICSFAAMFVLNAAVYVPAAIIIFLIIYAKMKKNKL
ncbi:MAG: TRAP transporter fused permease subunit [Deltaproteobacteria bacterium]|nr:TRAP transporter fused permease subunit [Deltaproteobacteria bacterium]